MIDDKLKGTIRQGNRCPACKTVIMSTIEDGTVCGCLKKEQRPVIKNLVLEGGGVKSVAYGSALKEMSKRGLLDNVKRVG